MLQGDPRRWPLSWRRASFSSACIIIRCQETVVRDFAPAALRGWCGAAVTEITICKEPVIVVNKRFAGQLKGRQRGSSDLAAGRSKGKRFDSD
jgi:hypothetical protein